MKQKTLFLFISILIPLFFACKNEQKPKIVEEKPIAHKQNTEPKPDDFRLKDSILIDLIERVVIKDKFSECPDSDRIRNSEVYSLMPDRNDFSCFVINDAICRGQYGSSGYEGAIGEYKKGKVTLLYDAFGKCVRVSDELTYNRRRVRVGFSGGIEELYFNGKRWETMDYSGHIPLPLIRILKTKLRVEQRLISELDEWDYTYKKIFQIKDKKIFSLEKFYSGKRGIQLIECEDYFSKCRELTLPTSADSVHVLNKKGNAYPDIEIFHQKIEGNPFIKNILTYKKGRYYSYDADIYGHPNDFYPEAIYECSNCLINPNTKEEIYKNGVPIIIYERKCKGNKIEKGVFYWNGTDYEKTTAFEKFFH